MRLPASLLGALVVAFAAPPAARGDVCSNGPPEVITCFPDAEVLLDFSRRFTGTYRHGEPYDVVTIDPAGTGETLEATGITLRVRLFCRCDGVDTGPIANLAADQIVLFSPTLCEWKLPAEPTDAEGWTEFHGTLRGGGCRTTLTLFVDGGAVVQIPIRINSPDVEPASPGHVDASDLGAFADRLGQPAVYDICFDYNEDGSVDASDLSHFASSLGAACD